MLRIEHHPNGPRVYVLGLRIHHGLTGCVLLLVGVARGERTLIRLGIDLIIDDAHDFPWALRERAPVSPGSFTFDSTPNGGVHA